MDTSTNLNRLVEALSAAHAAIDSTLSRSLSGALGISYSEYRILAALTAAPNRQSSRVDLAAAVGLTPSGVTRALRPLEKIGMVTSSRNERDARQTLATLTRSGARTVANAEEILADKLAVILEQAPTAAANLESLTDMLVELAAR